MTIEERIKHKLNEALQPTHLKVINQSHLHQGHAGDDGSGESHFHIEIYSHIFEKKSRVVRERLIFQALSEEMKIIHALSIKITI